MKKILKNIVMLLIMASLACGAAFSFAACGGDNGDNGGNQGGNEQGGNEDGDNQGGNEDGNEDGEAQDYIFEAEYIDVVGLNGSGISGSAKDYEMIQYDRNASNKYIICNTHLKGLTLTFNFTSDAAGKAKLTLKLGNEGQALPLNSDNLILKVNDKEVKYDVGIIPVNTSSMSNDYHDYEIGEIDVVEGENVITFTIGENDLMNGLSQGPLFDAIVLNSEAKLVFDAHEDNLDHV